MQHPYSLPVENDLQFTNPPTYYDYNSDSVEYTWRITTQRNFQSYIAPNKRSEVWQSWRTSGHYMKSLRVTQIIPRASSLPITRIDYLITCEQIFFSLPPAK